MYDRDWTSGNRTIPDYEYAIEIQISASTRTYRALSSREGTVCHEMWVVVFFRAAGFAAASIIPFSMRDNRPDTDSSTMDRGAQLSEFVRAVASKRRRFVLYVLQDSGNAEFEELTEQVLAWERKSEGVNEPTRKSVRTDLTHIHLPQLQDAGILRFNYQHGVVYLQPLPDFVEIFLDACAAVELPESTR